MYSLPGGIKIDNIKNKDEFVNIINNLSCCICLNILTQPLECFICNSLMCENCFQILKLAEKKCVTSKCDGKVQKANKFLREILSNLKIDCEFCDKPNMPYSDYGSHLDECEVYLAHEPNRMLKEIKDQEAKVTVLEEEIKKVKRSCNPVSKYSALPTDKLRNLLVTKKLPLKEKMELYNSTVGGRITDFKNCILQKNYPMFEEVSASSYYWTPLHYAMHYGQWEIIKFICKIARQNGIVLDAFRLESNDGRCPLLCLIRSSHLNSDQKKSLFIKILTEFPEIKVTDAVKKELSNRSMENLLKTTNK